MKFLAVLFLAVLPLLASDVRLGWDASTTPSVTNYVLYAATNDLAAINLTNAQARLNVGTNLTGSIESLTPGWWWFAVTAQKEGMESGLSNVLLKEVPQPPKNMRTVVVQFSGTLSNFYDVGFFKLRLP